MRNYQIRFISRKKVIKSTQCRGSGTGMLYKEVQNIKERVFENVRRALNHILVVVITCIDI